MMLTLIFGLYVLCCAVYGMNIDAANDEIQRTNTQSSITRDIRHRERLFQIKSELEEKLGRRGRRSNITRDQLPPSLLEELRMKLQEPSQAPILQDMIIFPDNGGGHCLEHSDFGLCLTWTIPQSLKYSESGVVTASMKIYKHVDSAGAGDTHLEVSWRNTTVAVEPTTMNSISGWVTVDISEVARAAVAEGDSEVSLWVSCPSAGVKVMTETSYRPYITVTTHGQIETERKKRSAVTCNQRPNECCLQEWYVTFAELDMTWVIEPEGFYANYCAGNCLHDADFTKLMQDNDHSFILYKAARKRAHRNSSWKVESLKPCCSATESVSLRIFEVREDKLLLRSLRDMRVTSCGCF